VFNEGFKNFIKGNWARARKQLRQIESIKRARDRPSEVLLEFMASLNYLCPDDWQGWRHADGSGH